MGTLSNICNIRTAKDSSAFRSSSIKFAMMKIKNDQQIFFILLALSMFFFGSFIANSALDDLQDFWHREPKMKGVCSEHLD